MKKILMVFVFFMLIYSASADSFGTYPINSNVSLIFSCQNSTYLNISKITSYPQSTIIMDSEKAATKAGSVYNYTVLPSNNTLIATYIVNYHCDLNGIDTPAVSSYEISNSGYSFNTGESIIIIISLLVIVFLAVIFFIFGISNKNLSIKIFCIGISSLFVIVLFGAMLNVFSTLVGKYPSMASILNGIYILLTVLATVGGIGIVIWLVSFSLNLWWKHRGFKD